MSATTTWNSGCCARLACATILLVGSTLGMPEPAAAQRNASPAALVQKMNGHTDAALREAEVKWRHEFRSLREPAKLSRLAQQLVSFEQKFNLGAEFFGDPVDTKARIRAMVRRELGDDNRLVANMRQFAEQYLRDLQLQDGAVANALGVPLGSNRGLCADRVDTAGWDGAFERVVLKAHALSQEDVARLAAAFIGGNLASDALTDTARNQGLNNFEDGSFADFVFDLAVNVGVGTAIDMATDPTESICQQLTAELEGVERELLEGPNGLMTTLRQASERHKQARQRLVKRQATQGASR